MTLIVACLDGLDPGYLDAIDTPEWEAIANEGTSGTCDGLVPSLTNVNNVSIVTSTFPETNGITGNTYYDHESDEKVQMKSSDYLRCETLLERASAAGKDVAMLTAKEKLEQFIGRGVEYAASAESPPEELEEAVGSAPDIYSGDASAWLLDAAVHVAETCNPDLLYVSTTDVVPHKHGPDKQPATEWVQALDAGLGALHEYGPLVATADHGMTDKTSRIDLKAILTSEGIESEVVQLIRDRHTYHHQNLGGAAYVYTDETASALDRIEGVEAVLSTAEAAERYRLPTDRIGDYLVLGSPETFFGPIEGDKLIDSVELRSHGSHHEQRVPYVASTGERMEYNIDSFDAVGLDV